MAWLYGVEVGCGFVSSHNPKAKPKADMWDFQTGLPHTCRGGGGGAEDIQRDQPSATPIVQDAKVLDNSEEMTREAQPKNRKR